MFCRANAATITQSHFFKVNMSRCVVSIIDLVLHVRSSLALLTLALVLAPTAIAAGLNDTGQTVCYQGSSSTSGPCSAAVTGDASLWPRQDGRYGRDARASKGLLTKVGSGAAGFDFTKVANDGTTPATGLALGANPADWACTKDNVTGLIWEVKTAAAGLRNVGHTYTWYSAATTNLGNPGSVGTTATCGNTLGANPCNTQSYVVAVNAANSGAGLCGHNDWRLPTPRELLTIVHAGLGNPAIDGAYFPNTIGNEHWTAPTTAFAPANAWAVEFYQGASVGRSKSTNSLYIRLVRGG